jgi:putative glutamine amidotransferase
MNRRPVIGITLDHNSRTTPEGVVHDQYLLPHPYSIAVEKAGGLPFLLPYRSSDTLVPQYVDRCDGIVLSGGNDYDPASWGEPRHPQAVPTDPERERFERALLAEIERRSRPVLGICGGCQIMNIHRGGTLHQFIPDLGTDIEHRRATIEEWSRRHDVLLDPASRHARLLGKSRVSSNTSHKQSVHRLGAGLTITARTSDGIVEGIEDPDRPFFVGVQWHPERQHDDPDHLALFQALVEHASR